MNDINKKRNDEKIIVDKMIKIYCKKNHNKKDLCEECKELSDYAHLRVEKCPHMEEKTFCSSCTTHCYDSEHRNKIKEVMRFSGPRILLHNPILAIKHILEEKEISIKNILFLVLGLLFMGIGAIGVFLPILPTTPFLLLSSYFFMKGSEKFNKWYRNTKLYKKHLESFEKERAMTLKTKISILSFASIMLLFPLIMVDVLPMRIFIVLLYISKYYYFIFRIRTIKEERV